MADPDRKGGEGLSLRTLVIASAASLTAAMVTSRLFPPGTIYASAVTPVIVTAVSEMLKRPADRVSELRRQRQTLVMQAARAPHGEESAALEGVPDFARGAAADEELAAPRGNGTGSAPPIKIHGRRRTPLLHPKVWVATGVVAFAIAVAVLTLPELIFGGAVTTSHRTTFFGGGSSSSTKTQTSPAKTDTQVQKTVTTTVPAQSAPQSTQTQTTTTETQTTTDTGTQTAPSGGAPAPTGTGTQTAPGGTAVPPTP